jgi:hypothetical protein
MSPTKTACSSETPSGIGSIDGDNDVLGLTAAQPAQHLAKPESREVCALVEGALAAQRALAARDEEAGDNPVSGFEALDSTADNFDHADEFVPEQLARDHRYAPVIRMKVGAADRAERHSHQCLVGALDGWLGHIHHLHLADALVSRRPHMKLSRF